MDFTPFPPAVNNQVESAGSEGSCERPTEVTYVGLVIAAISSKQTAGLCVGQAGLEK